MRRLAIPLVLVLLLVPITAVAKGSRGNRAVKVQGAQFAESSVFSPSPARCGPSPLFGLVFNTITGTDTLAGSYTILESFCADLSDANTVRYFDYEGTLTYLLTGEQATVSNDGWVAIRDANADTVTCVEVPKKPFKFTIEGYTGEHAGGRLKGRFTYVSDSGGCSGLDIPAIGSWRGVFTPNSPAR